jgi:peptide/nickel transport system ATP-binding protein
MAQDTLLSVNNLRLYFGTSSGVVKAVDDVSFELSHDEAVVIIGESGCGKSSLAKAILRLLPRNVHTYSGQIYLNGNDVMKLGEEAFRRQVRWVNMSLVPQAAMNALNPVLRVGDQVAEPMMVHYDVNKDRALEQARRMFEHVGVPLDFMQRYAFELSGGMRQRVAIAMSLVTAPALIILDEPTSALDVLTQANIMNMLKRIKQEMETSFILITHDIATSSELADKVAVMYAGQIVEISDAARFFSEPLHPYSRKLMASVPRLRGDAEPEFITGQPPSLVGLSQGCRFASRCPARFDRCDEDPPVIPDDGREVRCWLYENGDLAAPIQDETEMQQAQAK